MSLSFSDHVAVFLAPHGVRAALRPRGWRTRRSAPIEVACSSGPGPAWQPAAAALADALGRLGARRAAVSVTLSNHFVRYALVPPLAGVRRVDRVALARHHMQVVYGEAASDWHVIAGNGPSGGSGLAAAVEPALLEAVAGAVGTGGHRTVSIQPFLVAAYNACCQDMRGDAAWLAAAESGRVCVAAVRAGEWLAVRSQRLTAPLRDALPALLEQTRLGASAGASAGNVHLVSRDEPAFELAVDDGWSVAPVAWTH